MKNITESQENFLKSLKSSDKSVDNVPPAKNDLLFSFHRTSSQPMEESGTIRLTEEIEDLQQKISKLTNENRQYEKLLLDKSEEISKAGNEIYESELMTTSVKKMLE